MLDWSVLNVIIDCGINSGLTHRITICAPLLFAAPFSSRDEPKPPRDPMNDIRKPILFSAFERYSSFLLLVVSMAVLARLLSPEDLVFT